MTTPTAASDAKLIRELDYFRSLHVPHSSSYIAIDMAIARLRELTSQPPGLPSNAEEWVLLSEREPTHRDGDEAGQVLYLFMDDTQGVFGWDCSGLERATHWRRLPAPPAPAVLTTEEKIKAEDEKGFIARYGEHPGFLHPRETQWHEIRSAFLAGRQSLREGGV